MDVTGLVWMDVDTPEELVEARRLLPKLLRRGAMDPSDGPVARYLNRPITGRLAARLFLAGRIGPIPLWALSAVVGAAAGLAAALGLLLPAAVLVYLSSLLGQAGSDLSRLLESEDAGGLLSSYSDLALVAGVGAALWPLDALRSVLVALAAGGTVLHEYARSLALPSSPRGVSLSPGGRDVRSLVAVLALMAGLLEPLLVYMALVPLASSAALLALSLRGEGVPPRPRRPPIPEVEVRPRGRRPRSDIEENLASLVGSGVKLGVAVLLLRAASSLLSGVGPVDLAGVPLEAGDLLGAAETLAVIYFGYRMLMAAKFFADLASSILVRKMGVVTEAAVKRGLSDMLYLAFTGCLLLAVPPALSGLPWGWALAKAATLILLAVFALFLYDLTKLFYRSFRGAYQRMISALAERIGRAVHR